MLEAGEMSKKKLEQFNFSPVLSTCLGSNNAYNKGNVKMLKQFLGHKDLSKKSPQDF